MNPRRALLLATLALGPLAAALVRLPSAAWVEAHYAVAVGPALARVIGAVTGRVPFSVAGALALPLAAALVVALAHGARRPARLRRLIEVLPVPLAFVSFGYALFVLLFGLQYRREPIARRFGLSEAPATLEEVRDLAAWTIAATNAARTQVEEEPGTGVFRLSAGLSGTFDAAGAAYARAAEAQPWLGGRYATVKPVPFSALAAWGFLGGVYIPFTAEPHVNVAVPRTSTPFSSLHEMAHQRGVAREDEANFVAFYVGTRHGDADLAYSSWLRGAGYAVTAWASSEPEAAGAAWAGVSAAVARDLAEQRAWRDAHQSPLEGVGRSVNGAYLRSNGVRDGVESYGRVVDLMAAWRRAER